MTTKLPRQHDGDLNGSWEPSGDQNKPFWTPLGHYGHLGRHLVAIRSSRQFGHGTCVHLKYLKGFFELTWRPSRALNSPRALLPELQRYKDTVRCAALGAEVQGHRQQQLTQTLIVRLLKTHFFTPILDFEKSTE